MKLLQHFVFFVMSALVLSALVPAIAIAQSASGISAKIEKVDESADKMTLNHAAIPGLDMPAMTMVYKVRNSSPPFLWQGCSRGAIDAARKKARTGTPDRRRRQPAPSPAN